MTAGGSFQQTRMKVAGEAFLVCKIKYNNEFFFKFFFLPFQEENEGAGPTSSSTSPSTCPTANLRELHAGWGRGDRHGCQGEHIEACCGFTAYAATGIQDVGNWGWQVRGRRRHTNPVFLSSWLIKFLRNDSSTWSPSPWWIFIQTVALSLVLFGSLCEWGLMSGCLPRHQHKLCPQALTDDG